MDEKPKLKLGHRCPLYRKHRFDGRNQTCRCGYICRTRLRLNPQRANLLKALARTGSVKKAAREAGYGTSQAASKALASIRSRMPEALENVGLNNETLAKKYFLPLLKQTKVILAS